MMILDGKKVSARIKAEAAKDAETLKENGIKPCLAVILVGNDPASKVYVRNKKRACEECGIISSEYVLPEETTQAQLEELIDTLNESKDVDGILVQLPLPSHLDEKSVINRININKDVDAFHPVNVGKIMIGDYDFLPCTPAGVMELIKESGIDISGKHCVVVGRSNIVGKPQAMLLLHKNGTVTVCHSKTSNLKEECLRADIIVAAVGKENIITADMVKPGAVVIDVGMNRNSEGKLCGDVDFESVKEIAGAITPVPGGVGPMTIAMLMKNTIKAAQMRK